MKISYFLYDTRSTWSPDEEECKARIRFDAQGAFLNGFIVGVMVLGAVMILLTLIIPVI